MNSNINSWTSFAEKIDGNFNEVTKGFIGGDTVIKEIRSPKTFIQKKIRRSFGASSHYGIEKLFIEFSDEKFNFKGTRIKKKRFFKRFFSKKENQYQIEGVREIISEKILLSAHLNNLLKYSNSELIFLKNKIIFKSQSLGIMNEELEEVYFSMNEVSTKIKE